MSSWICFLSLSSVSNSWCNISETLGCSVCWPCFTVWKPLWFTCSQSSGHLASPLTHTETSGCLILRFKIWVDWITMLSDIWLFLALFVVPIKDFNALSQCEPSQELSVICFLWALKKVYISICFLQPLPSHQPTLPASSWLSFHFHPSIQEYIACQWCFLHCPTSAHLMRKWFWP